MEEMKTVETTTQSTTNNKFAKGVATGVGVTVAAIMLAKVVQKGASALKNIREIKRCAEDVEEVYSEVEG